MNHSAIVQIVLHEHQGLPVTHQTRSSYLLSYLTLVIGSWFFHVDSPCPYCELRLPHLWPRPVCLADEWQAFRHWWCYLCSAHPNSEIVTTIVLCLFPLELWAQGAQGVLSGLGHPPPSGVQTGSFRRTERQSVGRYGQRRAQDEQPGLTSG